MSEESSHDPVLALAISLLIGLVVRLVTSFIPQRWRVVPLPYTALILLLGCAVGAISNTSNTAYVSDSLRVLEEISPSVLFTVFLPALIMPSGLNLHWHVVKRVLDKALLLAVPGTLFNTALTALVCRYVLPYDWPWSGCWLLGGTLAATDPVAVVAIMHSVGASVKLATIIEGESLLNDGVAFVLFELFRRWASGENLTVGGVVGFVFKASLGGPALGLLWALLLMQWLAVSFNDGVLEITTSLVAGYTLWIVSDEVLGASGMLALVFFATALGAYGKAYVSRSVAPSFDLFWEWVDWVANTLVFFLSGLIVAVELQQFTTIDGRDWGYAVVLWLFLLLIRAAMTTLFFPLLRLGQYGIDWRDALVLSWAGLRGAVGLTLALIVFYSDNILDQEYRERFLFFMGFVAAVTLLVQGSTTSVLLRVLGYAQLPPSKLASMMAAAKAVERLGAVKISQAKKTFTLLGDADWECVTNITRLNISEAVEKRPVAKTEAPKRWRRLRRHNADVAKLERKVEREAIVDLRERLLESVLSLYREAFSAEFVSPSESIILEESVEKALDEIKKGLTDWEALQTELQPVASLAKPAVGMVQRCVRLWWSKDGQARRDAALCAAFAYAHAAARREFQDFVEIEIDSAIGDLEASKSSSGPAAVERQKPPSLSGDALQPYWKEHLRANGSGGDILHDAATELHPTQSIILRMPSFDRKETEKVRKHMEAVLEESREAQRKAEAHLTALRELIPHAVRSLRTRQVAMEVLKQEQAFLERMQATGLLEEEEVRPALTTVERRRQGLALADQVTDQPLLFSFWK